MPIAARKVVVKRSAALAMAAAVPFTAMIIAAPSASAAGGVWITATPATQTVAPGVYASWTYAAGARTRLTFKVTFGDGTSYSYKTPVGSNTTIGRGRHLFHPPCTARSHTYTQHWTATDIHGNRASTTTKVTALYSGPLCE